jgi:hypothetical protein
VCSVFLLALANISENKIYLKKFTHGHAIAVMLLMKLQIFMTETIHHAWSCRHLSSFPQILNLSHFEISILPEKQMS